MLGKYQFFSIRARVAAVTEFTGSQVENENIRADFTLPLASVTALVTVAFPVLFSSEHTRLTSISHAWHSRYRLFFLCKMVTLCKVVPK